jgi:phage baseplate assembly protein W
MAFGGKHIYPNDTKPRVAIGVEIPFNGNAVFIQNFQTKDAVKNNLINYFLTNPGERIANPTFGAGLRKFIFEQLVDNNLDFLKEDIESKLGFYFPNINVLSVEVLKNEEFNTIHVKITYSIKNANITDNLELTFT